MSIVDFIYVIGVVIALVLGIMNYVQLNKYKGQDLRIQLRTSQAEGSLAAGNLLRLIPKIRASRIHILAAKGLGKSGNMVAWNQETEEDMTEAARLDVTFPKPLPDHRKKKQRELGN